MQVLRLGGCVQWEYSMQIKEMAYNKKTLKQGLSCAQAIASENTCIFWT